MRYLPENIIDINELITDNPELAGFAKLFNEKRFIDVGLVIFSQPQREIHKDITIYGVWFIDKINIEKNIKAGIRSEKEVVQDFIALNRKTREYVYYSGGKIKDVAHQARIAEFCKIYGVTDDGKYKFYGCKSNFKTSNHRYLDEFDKLLPAEKAIRERVANRLREQRTLIKNEKRITS